MTKSKLEDTLETQLLVRGIRGFIREHRFAKSLKTKTGRPRQWRFDFAWPDKMLAVEVEGGTWAGGRHTRGSGFSKDCEKYNAATLLGWAILRGDAPMVRNGTLANTVEQYLREVAACR